MCRPERSSEWIPGFDAAARPGPDALVFAVSAGRLLVAGGSVPRLAELDAPPAGRPIFLGTLAGASCFAVTHEGDAADALELIGLRDALTRLPGPLAAVAGRAAQTVEWELGHAFCGRCGTATVPRENELARACPACGAAYWPRIAPAVIMLVEREGRVLLARRAGAGRGFHSVLAGFVEPGETLEQAVAREVLEEVGVEVADVRYFGSQPWPFPSQLMVGFTATATGGELHVQEDELAGAGWFAPDELPPVPPPSTIARRLIDDFLARHGS